LLKNVSKRKLVYKKSSVKLRTGCEWEHNHDAEMLNAEMECLRFKKDGNE